MSGSNAAGRRTPGKQPLGPPKGATAQDLAARLSSLADEREAVRKALAERLDGLLAARDAIAAELDLVDRALAEELALLRRPATVPEKASSSKPSLKGISRKPVVPVNESILKDALVCLIDGEKRKMLHRHLKSRYGITPEAYRAHFGLPEDYPMTAPGYSRSQSKAVSKAVIEGRFIPGGAKQAARKQAAKTKATTRAEA